VGGGALEESGVEFMVSELDQPELPEPESLDPPELDPPESEPPGSDSPEPEFPESKLPSLYNIAKGLKSYTVNLYPCGVSV
jgi:hypothetical protein